MSKHAKFQLSAPEKFDLPVPDKERVLRRDWDRYITGIFNRYRASVKKDNDKCYFESQDISEAYIARRKEVILRHLDEVHARYREHDGKWMPNWICDSFVNVCINSGGYAESERLFNWATAAAIWILDKTANDAGKRQKLYELLPRNAELFEDLYRMDFRDSRYDTDLILSVLYLIYNRNGEVEYDAQDDPRIALPNPAMKTKETSAPPQRKNFDAMMALIPQEEKDAAAAWLKELYWVWLDRFYEISFPYIETNDYFNEKQIKNAEQYNLIVEEVRKKLEEQDKKPAKKPAPCKLALQPANFSLDQMLAMKSPFPPMLSREESLEAFYERKMKQVDMLMEDYGQIIQCLDANIDELNYKTMNFALECEDFMFEDIDPFELCFALLYLIEQDDDLPWLYGPCIGLMTAICKNLPWGIGEYKEERDYFWIADEKVEFEKKYDAPAPDWNKRKYSRKGEPPRSMAQLVYELTGSLIPRDTHLYDGYYRMLKKHGVGSKDGAVLLTAMTTLATSEHKIPADNLDDWWTYDEAEDELDEVMKEADENEELVRQLRDQVKQLRISLHEAEKNARDAARELDLEKKDHEADRRELADLRELVFNREQNEQTEEPEPEEKEDLFPYEVKKTTLVFGGHDNWLKSIKLLLTGDIRFISKDQDAFDAGMLRKAEVIWLQPNCMSHKQFYKVMDHARQWKKQVRYFSNVSAVKSATQVMENDR